MSLLSKLRQVVRPAVTFVVKVQKTAFSPRYLLFTNVSIAVSLTMTGDIMQQYYQSVRKDRDFEWDRHRTRCMGTCTSVCAPLTHFWYLFLDRRFPGNAMKIVRKKVMLDQLFCHPTWVTIFLLTMATLEGRTWSQTADDFKEKGTLMYITDWMLWLPLQFFSFSFIPTRFRILYDSTITLFSDCFWSYLIYEMEATDSPLHAIIVKAAEKEEPEIDRTCEEKA